MSSDKNTSDLLGLAPYGEAIKIAVEKSFEMAQAFLNDLCRPATAEIGLLLRDQVRVWRANNFVRIALKAKSFIEIDSQGVQLKAPPRAVFEIMEHGSWCEDEQLQNLWAGLLASSCTADGNDDSNLMHLDILRRLSKGEAKLLEHCCKFSPKRMGDGGFIEAASYGYSIDEVVEITSCPDAATASAMLNHLVSLGLLRGGGFVTTTIQKTMGDKKVQVPMIIPEQLGLHFYVRCNGSRKSPTEFFH